MHADVRPVSDDAPPADPQDYLGMVWRLAVDGGLPPSTADDVCFVTLRNVEPAEGRTPRSTVPGHVMRTALEQRAVARCLAALRSARPARLHLVPKELGR